MQEFLGVRDRIAMLQKEDERTDSLHARSVQVYICQVMQLSSFRKVISNFIDDFLSNKVKDVGVQWTEESCTQALEVLKTFMDSYQSFLHTSFRSDCAEIVAELCGRGFDLHGRGNEIVKAVSQLTFLELRPVNFDDISCETLIHQVEDEIESIIRSAIRKQVEIEVYIGCLGRVSYILQRTHNMKEEQLQKKLSQLYAFPQTYYDIPTQHISSSSWAPIVSAFQELRHHMLPCDKIQHLLELSKAIPALHRLEHPELQQALGADDLFPIFIYVVVQSRLPGIWAMNQELQQLCDPDRAFSEAGYYLATLEACLSHLLTMNIQTL
jgi:hypothetical protein